ncbi:MAG: glycosyltransferase family 39 protein [Verrucomicrobiales bacterium]|jgi:hypothetical protein|nr:glycosyltransferase family 39 protein [Verrucomicrobiales bacterium]
MNIDQIKTWTLTVARTLAQYPHYYALVTLALLATVFFLFYNLGHYALWEDEALTAMAAKGAARHGDTSAWVGDGNLSAIRNGLHLDDHLRERATPALPIYLTAASFRLFGETPWTARLPHALIGLLTVALLLRWARELGGPRRLALVALLVLGNVSFWLFFRQCRYYGLSSLCTLAAAYGWWRWRGRRRDFVLLSLALLGLLCSQPIVYVAAGAALAVDWLGWRRGDFSWRELCALAVPQAAGVAWVYCCWNPWSTGFNGQYYDNGTPANDFCDTLTIFYWHLRDLNRCEFYAALPVLAALTLAWRARWWWVYRAVLAALVMTLMVSQCSTQFKWATTVADVRFNAQLIPLLLLVEAAGIALLCRRRWWLALTVTALVAFTNLGNGGWWLPEGARSTAWQFARELLTPPRTDPFTPTAAWLREHTPPGATVLVEPNADVYPLLFLAPRQLYVWQLDAHMRDTKKFGALDAKWFKGGPPPDYLVAFGAGQFEALRRALRDSPIPAQYELAARLDIWPAAIYRPELFWHSFTTVPAAPQRGAAVYVFQRLPPSAADGGGN